MKLDRPAPHHDRQPPPGDGEPPVLELTRVSKTYPGEPPLQALRDVDLTLERGEMLAIVGPSGSGKSTLLHIMGTLDWATSGTVRITGLDVAHLTDHQLSALRARRIGFLFQQFFLAEHRSALDNVADGLLYAGRPRSERLLRAQVALERVGLGDRLHALAGKLSGGQKQRVALARALIGEPDIILAEEPTGALDSATGANVMALLQDLHDSGATIIVITHDRNLADSLPRQIEILDGRVVARNPPP